MKQSKTELPKLPHGEGSMEWRGDKILYRKSIKVGNLTKRLNVKAATPKEALKKMKEAEKEAQNATCEAPTATLSSDMSNWLRLYKAPILKPSSYDRLESTFNCQIKNYPIASIRWKDITANEIQKHLLTLVDKRLSRSSIKKVYDLLSNYYRWKVDNHILMYSPMTAVVMPTEENVLTATKQIKYLKKEEIPLFVKEATKLCNSKPIPTYRWGQGFVFILYTGIRAGEAIALKWKDINFEKKTVIVEKNMGTILNRDYKVEDPALMLKKGIKKRVQYTGTTKTSKIRIVPLNPLALKAAKTLQSQSKHANPDDYVFCTRDGRPTTQTHLDRSLSSIILRTPIDIEQCGCHMLRHTCASLLFASGVPIATIANLLGHSETVCREIYVHFYEEQKAMALQKITETIN